MTSQLTAADHERVSQAIRAAEARTAGEIYCVVARSSDDYFASAMLVVTVAIAILGAVVAFMLDRWWETLRPPAFMAAFLLSLACAFIVLWLLPAIRIHFVPRRLRFRRAHENALKQFIARNVHRTSARTGVLVFVSLAERYATVVADSGINEKVSQEAWNGIVAGLVDHARRDRLADGFVEAVGVVGALLAQYFPVAADDRNELDDHLVEI